jgi:HEAT repeat protein
VPAVVRLLREEEDPRVRTEALLALEAAGGQAAGEAVVARLRDQDLTVRRTAFEVVARMGLQRPALPALIDLLSVEEPRMRRDIVIAIGDARDTTALSALIRALREDKETVVRQVAANALLKLRDPRATEALIRALDDPDRRVHPFAMRALTTITRELFGEDREAWKRWWEEQGRQGRR